jgi:hypothetical protein
VKEFYDKGYDIHKNAERIDFDFPPKKTKGGFSYYLPKFNRYSHTTKTHPSEWYSVTPQYINEVFGIPPNAPADIPPDAPAAASPESPLGAARGAYASLPEEFPQSNENESSEEHMAKLDKIFRHYMYGAPSSAEAQAHIEKIYQDAERYKRNKPTTQATLEAQGYLPPTSQQPQTGVPAGQMPRMNMVNPTYYMGGGESLNPALAAQIRMMIEQGQGANYQAGHGGRRTSPSRKILQYFNPALYSPDEYMEADYV